MNFEKQLIARSGEVCELSGSTENLQVYQVQPSEGNSVDDFILITQNLKDQLEDTKEVVPNDWRCLNDAMWSEVSAVKVVSYRMLNNLKQES
jgi:protein PhnA